MLPTRRFSPLSVLRLASLSVGTVAILGLNSAVAQAQRSPIYNPLPMPEGDIVTDNLSASDIPTGNGGFARDYLISLEAGDQVVMDLTSDAFDTIITLIAPDGRAIGQNDDGPDGTTNSLLFTRVTESGNYILRVSPYGGRGEGIFTLQVTRLRPVGADCP